MKNFKKVLVIDDDKDVADIVADYLVELYEDFRPVICRGYESFKSNTDNVELVLCDLWMADGTASFKKIKDYCNSKNIPFIAVTGDLLPVNKFQISKPLNKKQIVSEVTKSLEFSKMKKAA